ncbi:MAG: hypothetical protein WBV25_15255, partial [Methylocella sp.]
MKTCESRTRSDRTIEPAPPPLKQCPIQAERQVEFLLCVKSRHHEAETSSEYCCTCRLTPLARTVIPLLYSDQQSMIAGR